MAMFENLCADLYANTPKQMSLSGSLYRLVWALLFCQGFQLCVLFRTYSWLNRCSAPLRFIGRMLFNASTFLFGCHLYAEARIGGGLHLPHPTGIVIGSAVIGSNVTIYQNVTIGLSGADSVKYPELSDGSVIFSGAVVVGDVRVGIDSIVGANSVVLIDIPDGQTAVGVPARVLPPKGMRRTDVS